MAGAYVVQERAGGLLPDVQAQPAMPLAHRVEERLEAVPRAGGEADDELAGLAAAGRPGGGERVLDGLQGSAGGVEQRDAGLGELDAAGRPREQLDVELLLEAGDRRAQRLLGHVQPARRAREVQLLGDGDEVAQVPQLDIHSVGV